MKYPFKNMPVGRCYFVEPKDRVTATQAAYRFGRRNGMVFTSRTINHTSDFSLVCIKRVA